MTFLSGLLMFVVGFIPPLLFYYKTTLAQCFCISAALTIALRSFGIDGNGIHSSLVGSDS